MVLKVTITIILIICCHCLACQQAKKEENKNDHYKPILSETNTRTQNKNINDNGALAPRRRLERQVAARLREDILWSDIPEYFHVPKADSVEIAFCKKGKLLWYCSRDLGGCGQYKLDGADIDQRSNRVEYDKRGRDIITTVREYAGEPTINKTSIAPHLVLKGTGGDTGEIVEVWTDNIKLGTWQEIADQHRKMRPTELIGLREHLLETLKGAGYHSITIACFDPLAYSVQIYGDRPAERGGPIVFSERWDTEREQWVTISMLEEQQNPKDFSKRKALIFNIACETMKLN